MNKAPTTVLFLVVGLVFSSIPNVLRMKRILNSCPREDFQSTLKSPPRTIGILSKPYCLLTIPCFGRGIKFKEIMWRE